jgi:hypothetical protein
MIVVIIVTILWLSIGVLSTWILFKNLYGNIHDNEIMTFIILSLGGLITTLIVKLIVKYINEGENKWSQ